MSLTAADVMTRDVLTAKPYDTAAKIAGLLSEHDISAMPVCDVSGAVIGMVSEEDLLAPLGTARTAKRNWWLQMLADGTDLAPAFLESIDAGNRRIADLMVSRVLTASPDASVADLAEMIVKHHVKRLPIVQNGKLVGVVSRADLLRAFATKPSEVAEPL